MPPTDTEQSTGTAIAEADIDPIVELKELSKIYGEGSQSETVTALESINLVIREGEFVSFIGPSGCGKTTLLRIVSGLLQPTSGEVLVRGTPVTEPIANVGFVFQSPVLMDWKTVRGNVMFSFDALDHNNKLDKPREHYEQRADELLEMVGIEGFEDAYPKELSGGMQQRVAICRALLPDPDILLMDEPFGSLDEFTREKLNNDLLDIWGETEKTIIFVSHNIQETVYLSDRVVALSPRPGRVETDLEIDIDRPRNPSVRDSEAYHKSVAELRGVIGVSETGGIQNGNE